jgi:hypothetical protein
MAYQQLVERLLEVHKHTYLQVLVTLHQTNECTLLGNSNMLHLVTLFECIDIDRHCMVYPNLTHTNEYIQVGNSNNLKKVL